MNRHGPLNVGLIGAGAISEFYTAAVDETPEIQLVGACDVDSTRLRSFDPAIICTTDYRDILASPDVDAVVVLVPNDQHFEICRAALEAGKHVCVEKPLTLRTGHAAMLNELAVSENRTLFTAFHRRYNQHVADLRERLTDPYSLSFIRIRYNEMIEDHAGTDSWYLDPVRCGGGCIADNGPNAFDLIAHLGGKWEVVEAKAVFEAGVDRSAVVRLEGKRGARADIELDWGYRAGEQKDVLVRATDGSEMGCDLLAGFPAFKSSLYHEYAGVVRAFIERIAAGVHPSEDGAEAVSFVEDVYARVTAASNVDGGLRAERARPVFGRLVKLLTHTRDDRGMTVMEHDTRCMTRGEIHELVVTDTRDLSPGDRVDSVGFLGFVEIDVGGVVAKGDVLRINGRYIGRVAGFDDCHWPNHYNILVERPVRGTASTLGLELNQLVELSAP